MVWQTETASFGARPEFFQYLVFVHFTLHVLPKLFPVPTQFPALSFLQPDPKLSPAPFQLPERSCRHPEPKFSPVPCRFPELSFRQPLPKLFPLPIQLPAESFRHPWRKSLPEPARPSADASAGGISCAQTDKTKRVFLFRCFVNLPRPGGHYHDGEAGAGDRGGHIGKIRLRCAGIISN